MDQRPPRCAYLPCPEPVVKTLQHGKDTYHLCFDHLCAAAQEGLVNEQRALRAETRYAELLDSRAQDRSRPSAGFVRRPGANRLLA